MTGETGIHEQMVGDDRDSGAISALSIVSGELMETIRNAHLALEDCVDGRGGTTALKRAGELLHLVGGALRMTETYGAALLVEEMELACDYLTALRSGKGREDGLDALTRSMVQLPVYIERLLGGGRDIALVLLPMLNDLRAVRGEPLLSEGTLLLLNLSPSRSEKKDEPRAGSGEDPVLVAKRLRPKFQLALLGWIKGGDSRRHLDALGRVSAALQNSSTRDDMYQLWWVVSGVLEALQDGGLETTIAIKRLLGQTDRQLKYVIDEGLLAYERHPVDDLLNNLLYYVARSSTSGERISEIRAAFNLEELLPGDEQVEEARDALSAPSAKLMETVATAIKDDLSRVKDVLDIFVRTGMNKSSELVPQLELLKKISDTLGVLGLGELRGDVDGEIERLKSVVERGGVANDQVILDIASTLLRVEDRLDQQLVRLTAPKDAETAVAAEDDSEEFQKVTESVMRECIINLARIKETISQSFTEQAASQGLDSVAVADSRHQGRAADARQDARDGGRRPRRPPGHGDPGRRRPRQILNQKETDRLADVIVSIEYYMETVKAGRSEPWYMLDNAEACLDGTARRRRAPRRRRLPLRRPKRRRGTTGDPETVGCRWEDCRGEGGHEEDPARRNRGRRRSRLQATVEVIRRYRSWRRTAEHLDPELLELFIEEAKEEIASIKRKLPAMGRKTPDDMESLITVRRSFHTLKGQRPHGWRGAHRRILLGRRESAEQADQPDAGRARRRWSISLLEAARRCAGAGRAAGSRDRRRKPICALLIARAPMRLPTAIRRPRC